MVFCLAKRNGGLAMVIVMIVIAALVVVATGFAHSMSVEARLVRNVRFNPDMDWLGRSGVELARYILSKQVPGEERMDALHQRWAGGPGRLEESIEELAAWEKLPLSNVTLGQGKFSIKITDRERKLNINSASDTLLRFVLEMHAEVPATDVDEYIDSLRDWIDTDDDSRLNGAESDDYLGGVDLLDGEEHRPYFAKNGPLDHISELKMIKGFRRSPEVYAIFEKHFTAISGGLVNINTASAEVLGLLPGMDPAFAQEIVAMRSDPIQMGPLRDLGQLSQLEHIAPPGLISEIRRDLSTQSATFEVEVTAQVGEGPPRKYRSLLRRVSERDIRILYFHSD